MTSEYDIPEGLLGMMQRELQKDKPNKQYLKKGVELLMEFISGLHSFSHDLAMKKLDFKDFNMDHTVKLPATDHFLSMYRETNEAIRQIDGFTDAWRRVKKAGPKATL